MSTTQTAPAGESVKVDTEYVMLARGKADAELIASPGGETYDGKTVWHEVGKVTARNAEAATKKYAEDNPPKTGESLTVVAVATKRWTPVTFRARTVTTVEAVT